MKNKTLTIVAITLYFSAISQTGPGGVGSNAGTSSLSGWFDANQGVTTTGTAVTQWDDQSGYGNNATPPAVANRPTQTSAAVNSYPVLTFDGSTDYLTAPDAISLDLTSWSIFIVGQINTHKNFNTVVVKGADNQENYEFLTNFPGTGNFHYPVRYTTGARSSDSEPSASFSNTTYGVYQLDYDQSNFNIYINGLNTETDAENRVPLTNNNSLYICNEEGTTGRNFSGTIAEIAIFSSPVNSAQRIIINNYLAAKYNFSLSSNNLYDEDDNGDYDHDVAGIGRVDAANIHSDAQGTGMVRISNPSNLGDDEFLIWGHDNGVAQATNIVDVPGTVQARFDRVWRVSERNSTNTSNVNVGDVQMDWDLTGLGLVTASDLRLLIDTDNDGSFADETPISGATAQGGNIYRFGSVPGGATGIRNNRRFTIATINTTQTPLPIELINFTVYPTDDKRVLVNWQTASEINNDFFTIERSINGLDWEQISIIDGGGNSSSLLNYSEFDDNPHYGVSYYRLKQTDFDGQFEYSQIRSVNIERSINSTVEIYPNPTTLQIMVRGSSTELEEIILYNVLGQNVTDLTNIVIASKTKLIIDISKLNSGMYYVRTKTITSKVHKQ